MNHTSSPDLTTYMYVKMSQLRNKPSYIDNFTIWAELEKKTLPLRPMEKQLRILPQLLRYARACISYHDYVDSGLLLHQEF